MTATKACIILALTYMRVLYQYRGSASTHGSPLHLLQLPTSITDASAHSASLNVVKIMDTDD